MELNKKQSVLYKCKILIYNKFLQRGVLFVIDIVLVLYKQEVEAYVICK